MKKYMVIGVAVFVLLAAGFISVKYYSFVFAKTVRGEILRVERVSQADAIVAGGRPLPPEQLFSFAVSIKDTQGEIHTASSEDRQWAVAQQGQCVEARFFPYPPWDLEKANTYYGARLERLFECQKK